MSRLRRRVVLGLSAVTVVTLVTATPAVADKGWHCKSPTDLPKVPLMVGSGGAVSSVDLEATQVGIDVLRRRQRRRRGDRDGGGPRGHRAVLRRHRRRRVPRLLRRQGRRSRPSTAGRPRRPASPTTSSPTPTARRSPFAAAVSSGLSVGVPGTPALWEKAARQFGTMSLGELLQPAERLAEQRIRRRQDLPRTRLRPTQAASASSRPPRGSTCPAASRPWSGQHLPQPGHGAGYRSCAPQGVDALYSGEMGQAVVDAGAGPRDRARA